MTSLTHSHILFLLVLMCCVEDLPVIPIMAMATAPSLLNPNSKSISIVISSSAQISSLKPLKAPLVMEGRSARETLKTRAGLFGSDSKRERLLKGKTSKAIIQFDKDQAKEILRFQDQLAIEFTRNGVSDKFDQKLHSLVVRQQIEKTNFLVNLENGLIDLDQLFPDREFEAAEPTRFHLVETLEKMAAAAKNIIPKK